MIRPANDTDERTKETLDQRSVRQKIPTVYFLAVRGGGVGTRIKIGFSAEHEVRKRQHAKNGLGSSLDIETLCIVRGTKREEKMLHDSFIKCRMPNQLEVYWPEAAIVDYIRWLRDQFYVWVPEGKDKIEDLPCLPFNIWEPTEDRVKAPPKSNGLFPVGGELGLPPREETADDYYTNAIIIEAARKVLGTIDLDPASHAKANEVVKADRFFTKGDNGLEQEWAGNIWINPPFSQWAEWVVKIRREWNSGRVKQMCILCATRTLTANYFAPIHRESSAICIIKGRIALWGRNVKDGLNDGHAIFYFGENIEHFKTHFGELGTVYQTLKVQA